MNRLLLLGIACATALLVGHAALSAPRLADAAPAEEKALRTFLADYCVGCHSGAQPDAGLDLAKLSFAADDAASLQAFRRAADRVRGGEMPPPDAPQPGLDLRTGIADGLDAHVLGRLGTRPLDPGRVTVRRLSRVEYRRTIRDLLGIDFRPSSGFPNDDLAYGFDNIGDVLSVSPLLLEKYARAAEEIAEQAIRLEDPENPEVRRLEAESMASTMRGDGRQGDVYNLFASGDLTARVRLPRDGEYILRALALADQAGPDKARLAFIAQGRHVHTVEMTKGDREAETHEFRLRLPKGENVVGVGFPNDFYDPGNADPSERDRNLIVDWLEVVGPVDAKPFSAGQTWLVAADPGKGKPLQRGRAIAKALLERAWRRKPKTDEVKRVSTLMAEAVEAGQTWLEAIRLGVRAALVSPHFLYRLEPGATSGKTGSTRRIGDAALAVRLSYFLWSSMPDAELFTLAKRRKLTKPGALAAQVTRMLQDPRARALSTNFAVQWLELRNLETATPDPAAFPTYTAELAEDMRREAELFFQAVLDEKRDVRELLSSSFTFVNERLARHYGLEGISGDAFQRVELTGGRRGGLLTQAGVLTVTSNPTRTSPVKRGKWILENLLDAATPPPPPGADSLDEEVVTKSAATLREKLEVHRADPVCASCHVRMDSLGFALERFDPIGAWRPTSDGKPIDAGATLPDGRKVAGAPDLRSVLAADTAFLRCLAKKLFIYAVGRNPTADDELAIFRLVAGLPVDKPTLAQMIQGIVSLEAFTHRRVKE